MMTHKILNRDPKDEILKAFRLFIEWCNDFDTGDLPWPKVNLLNQVDARESTVIDRQPKLRAKDGWYEQKNNYGELLHLCCKALMSASSLYIISNS